MISDERLEEVVNGDILFTDEQREMAKELLALRKATSETYGWIAEYPSQPIGIGGMSYEFHDNQLEAQMAANEYEGFAIEVCRKP